MADVRTDTVFTWTNDNKPTTKYGTNPAQLIVKGLTTSVPNTLAWIGLSSPVPLGVIVHSAKLLVNNKEARTVSTNLRMLAIVKSWDPGKINHKTRPTTQGDLDVTITKASAPKDSLWELDLTSYMQQVANGTKPWYGVSLSSNAQTNARGRFHGSGKFAPRFEIDFSYPITKPSGLSPSGVKAIGTDKPIVMADNGGGERSSVSKVQVQLVDNPTGSPDFSAPSWDSGWLDALRAEVNLATASGVPSLAPGGVRHYRMRVTTSYGTESEWSDPVSFTFQPLGALTLVKPSSGKLGVPDGQVDWTFTGTQKYYQILLMLENPGDGPSLHREGDLIWDSGKTLDPLPADSIDRGALVGLRTDAKYTLYLRVWDDQDRQEVPGFPTYREVKQTGLVVGSGSAIDPVTSLTIIDQFPLPEVLIRFTSSDPDADSFSVVRDGVYVDTGLLLPDHETSTPGLYEYKTLASQSRNALGQDWKIIMEGLNSSSGNNPSAVSKVQTSFGWISNMEIEDPIRRHIPLVGPSPLEGALSDSGQNVEIEGAGAPFRVFTTLGKYRGKSIAKLIPDATPDLDWTLNDLVNAMREVRAKCARGETVKITLFDLTLDVIIYDVNLWPTTGAAFGKSYDVTFNWFQA